MKKTSWKYLKREHSNFGDIFKIAFKSADGKFLLEVRKLNFVLEKPTKLKLDTGGNENIYIFGEEIDLGLFVESASK